jgi:transposase
MGERSIQPYIRAQAVALYQSGLNLSKISKQLKISRCRVRNAIIKFEKHGIFEDLKRSGRPKPVSKDTIRRYLTKLGYEYTAKLKNLD